MNDKADDLLDWSLDRCADRLPDKTIAICFYVVLKQGVKSATMVRNGVWYLFNVGTSVSAHQLHGSYQRLLDELQVV